MRRLLSVWFLVFFVRSVSIGAIAPSEAATHHYDLLALADSQTKESLFANPEERVIYDRLEKLDTPDLITEGNRLLSDRSTHSQAFAAFSIVVNRFYKSSNRSDREIKQVVTALTNLGYLNLISFYKYDQAFKYLTLARRLAEDNNLNEELPHIYIHLANLHEINKMAYPYATSDGVGYTTDAWNAAKRVDNEELMPVIAADMAILSYSSGCYDKFKPQLEEFLSYPFHSQKSNMCDISRDFVKGVMAWQTGHHTEAEAYFTNALSKGDGYHSSESADNQKIPREERMQLSILSALAEMQISTSRYDAASATLNLYADRILHNSDFTLDLYDLYLKYYRAIGQPDSIKKYDYLYLKEKETVTNDKKLYDVGEQEFVAKIEKINDEVIQLSDKNRRQRQQLILALLALMCLSAAIGIAIWAYLRLRGKSEQLYRKNVEMIEEQRQFSARQKELIHELEAANRKLEEVSTSQSSTDEPQPNAPSPRHSERQTISAAEADSLFSRLVAIMEEKNDIYQPDFSLERLAQLASARPRIVSQVINMKTGFNFSKFLNDYRIREACLRFQDSENYGNLTVEAIAESVGYRSRTGFSSLFKKATGLSPSVYQRLAKRSN